MKFHDIKEERLSNDRVYCDVWHACKLMAKKQLEEGKRLTTIEAIADRVAFDEITDLITWSGDWGIERNECNITGAPRFHYTIQDAAHAGVYLHLDIKSVVEKVSRWYMTNMKQFLHPKIYPIPMGINYPDWEDIDLGVVRSVEKENLCYANFTMTAPYRTRVAEWCWSQEYIDCNFPPCYPNQASDLNMPIIKGERYAMPDFVKRLASYHYAIAPCGNGIDTFRTWECILCNTVPIVQDSWMNRVFSKIWPMIIVKKYEFSNVYGQITKFRDEHGQIDYDISLLQPENFDQLLDRIKYESDRIRRNLL